MRKFTRWIAARFIPDHENINDLQVRARYGALEGWVSVVINNALFVLKLVIGLAINSVSVVADAVHTLTDSATSVILIIGFKLAKKPSDRDRPFGYGRMESVATLTLAVLLVVSGIELLKSSIHGMLHPSTPSASLGIIMLITATIVVKELMTRFANELGDLIDSQALKADAVHHRSDAITTGLVVVALIASQRGYAWVDGAMGLVLSLVIAYSGFAIAREAINPLLGEAPSRDTLKGIEKAAEQHNGVLGVHDIIYHKYGMTTIISLHIEISDKESVIEAHELSEAVEEDIARITGGTVIVHADPINRDHPKYESIAETIKEIVSADQRVHSFHDLRLIGRDLDKCNVVFEVALEEDVDEQEIHDIIRSIQQEFRGRFPQMKMVVKADPKYAYNL
ncbi:MAG: cation-efflux pump [Planctomycetes bacterium]|nr:cation-efflux pump [Planctomycetota bacterium]